ncbi:MAG: Hsp70 family protein [Gemmatales bacterium]|nr:hsp70 family protein [Gemmatales bacterium]MDW7995072.1 Hsp70 family protein [Gemmatales bacterium]
MRYCIGIDLGTTNTALAYVECRRGDSPRIQTFLVPQLVAPGELASRPLLPSFLYLAGPHDWPQGASSLPWDPHRQYVVGELAREQGARVPGRLVSSAKSWLCHGGVDRESAILPWNGLPDVPRVSPVEASARYLRHLVEAWNWVVARTDDSARLERQEVVLTIPASFDEMARRLTLEAARQAGLERVTLLEEPQAAFYAWMAAGRCEVVGQDNTLLPTSAEEALAPGTLCVVIDVGGGTTDFTLIQAVERAGELDLVRQAVGEHLLLGGDNMDLALARYVEQKLGVAGKLDAVAFFQLAQACRRAKEILLGERPPAAVPVTVMGRGRAVVGGTLSTTLTLQEITQVLLDGFFPYCDRAVRPNMAGMLGLHEMGLPYVRDPAIPHHLALFLRTFAGDQPPQAVLFNGGVFQSAQLRQRLLDVMCRWYDAPDRPWRPRVLTNPSLDLAVAWGAAYYGWLRQTGGKRIRSGLARSYYLGIAPSSGLAEASSAAASGQDTDMVTVVCVAPRQLEEGAEIRLERPEMLLKLGQPVSFPLFASAVRPQDQPGQLLQVQRGQLQSLPMLTTVLKGGKRSGVREIPVTVTAKLTEIGTLELGLASRLSEQRWKLEFPLRHSPSENVGAPASEADGAETSPSSAFSETWPEEIVQAAGSAILAAFESNDLEAVRQLPKRLEEVLKLSRDEWPLSLCRQLWPFLAQCAAQRSRSPTHLTRWYHLVGFCLRPGFGEALDAHRVEQLWKLLAVPGKSSGATSPRAGEGGPEYWIMWRRVAGGLNAALQQALFDRLRPFLLPVKGKSPPYRPNAHEWAEMWRTAASLERLPLSTKQQLGEALLRQVKRRPIPPYAFWALARLGSRQPLYGPWNCVAPAEIVTVWLQQLLQLEAVVNDAVAVSPIQADTPEPSPPTAEGGAVPSQEVRDWLFCLAQLARRTGLRNLDVQEDLRHNVVSCLQKYAAPSELIQAVQEGGWRAEQEAGRFFGEKLPLGLRLAEPALSPANVSGSAGRSERDIVSQQ